MVLTVEPGLYFDPERESGDLSTCASTARRRCGSAATGSAWPPRGRSRTRRRRTRQKVTHPIPAEYRGIGIRIEDDILITAGGYEVLTAGTPKTIDEVERVCAEASPLPR